MKNILYDTKAAKILRSINQNISYCGGCGIPWNYCKPQIVMTSSSEGMFATCTDCWKTLSLFEIKECFKNVYESQEREGQEKGIYVMDYTLHNLLIWVENEYNKTHD